MRFSMFRRTRDGEDHAASLDDTKHEQHGEKEVDVEKSSSSDKEDESKFPPFKVVLPSVIAVYLSIFLIALDRTIIGVAIPAISNEFDSFGDISWYESSYLLTFCTLQLPMGRIYTFFSTKWVFLVVIFIFVLGSIVSAAAPSSNAFIVGRAISGIGGAGSFAGGVIVIVNVLPNRKRPKYQGFLGAVFGLASILGPLLGGVFTTHVTWRWCFWINVPIGGLAFVAILVILPASPPVGESGKTIWDKLLKLDPIGTAFLIPALICLLFAIQWGGVQYPWSDARVIALLVVGCVLLVLFAIVQAIVKDDGTVPPRILCQRSIASGAVQSLGGGAALVIWSFYIPIWFQVIKGLTAVDAGVRLLAYFLGTVVFVILSGIVVSKTGYYTPWGVLGGVVMTVGAGLLTTFKVNTGMGEWIGYQIIIGAGMGMSMQQPQNAAQTVLPTKDIPIGTTLLAFARFFGGSIFIAVCQTILSNSLISELSSKVPGLNASAISHSGASNIKNLVPADKLAVVITAYNNGLVKTFYVALALSILALIAAPLMEWKSVKTPRDEKK